LELGQHGSILVCLCAPGAEGQQFPSICETCDYNCFDVDYDLWIRLLQLHCSARQFLDREPDAPTILKEQIAEVEKLVDKRVQ